MASGPWNENHLSSLRMFSRKRQILRLLAAFALLSQPLVSLADTPPALDSKTNLDTVTVEAARQREQLSQEVNRFVSGIVVTRSDQSLANWQSEAPICPLVAGLPRDDGEYMLRRFSQIATTAGAPLAPEHCKPNLVIVVTSEPDALLKAWNRRDVNLFDSGDDHGGTEVRTFLNSKAPVRAWYNVEIYNDDGTPLNYLGGVPGLGLQGPRTNTHSTATRIKFNDVRNLYSVIVVVDANRVRGVSFGQLAAYVSMLALAEIRIDPKVSGTASILQLFSTNAEKPPPAVLSEWDKDFLAGLYQTSHLDQHQISAVKSAMVGAIAAHP